MISKSWKIELESQRKYVISIGKMFTNRMHMYDVFKVNYDTGHLVSFSDRLGPHSVLS